MSIVSERLKELLREKHISFRKLADMTGIKKSSVANYVNGARPIPLDKLQDIAAALGVDPSWLIGWADDRSGIQIEQLDNIEPLEDELLTSFSALNRRNQTFVLKMIQELLENQSQSSDSQD